jgi:hypothetical protein
MPVTNCNTGLGRFECVDEGGLMVNFDHKREYLQQASTTWVCMPPGMTRHVSRKSPNTMNTFPRRMGRYHSLSVTLLHAYVLGADKRGFDLAWTVHLMQ